MVTGQRLEPDRTALACRVVEHDQWCRRGGVPGVPAGHRLGRGATVELSRRALRWALESIVVGHLSVARVAAGLGVAWDTANAAALAEGRRVLTYYPARFDGVTPGLG